MLSFSFASGLVALLLLPPLAIILKGLYNIFLHPLANKVPGPFWARFSGLPSWYYAYRGDRHLWLHRQFKAYGYRVRIEPNTVLFCHPQAYDAIYSMKANVRRGRFYEALKRDVNDTSTLTCIDVAAHAKKRRCLNLCFTERSILAACRFVIAHVDRWIDIITSEDIQDADEWSQPLNFSDKVDALIFDITSDLSFGKSFNIKEPEDNPFKDIPHNIAEWLKFHYLISRVPFLDLLLWLKPRGLDRLFGFIAPPSAKHYDQFVQDSVTSRIAVYREQDKEPEEEGRQDLFHFLAEARDPKTGTVAYDENELRAESNLLLIAGSDTSSISLSGIFFYLTGNQLKLNKLMEEIRTTFQSLDDIVYGQRLRSCTYLRACIDEGMRLTPPGPSELPREVLSGGIEIKGEFYPAGTIVGTTNWANSRNPEVYEDPDVFRPERWIVDEATGVTKESVARAKAAFHPFSSGPASCIGQNLAMAEIQITIARTLYQLDVRRAPGSTLGGGSPELGWGRTDPNQYQLVDAYISLREGPEVQFRRRGFGA
ncbi:cytochrome P450 monooxygenase-like protein [Xylaria bambusicola]|uniref:cytochrome P450 monooxygenase-like protein n=1 Tax=Xylaria bambusicola TaxID=326684 RepID=UPI0020089A51|nr:cytochrome P450 monooxygenase-like protein [Xylaria bambusicola]KAI0505420.1 cytochrome P450 monooxygenase-like protein [Xylaria bambusicola]